MTDHSSNAVWEPVVHQLKVLSEMTVKGLTEGVKMAGAGLSALLSMIPGIGGALSEGVSSLTSLGDKGGEPPLASGVSAVKAPVVEAPALAADTGRPATLALKPADVSFVTALAKNDNMLYSMAHVPDGTNVAPLATQGRAREMGGMGIA